ncbi:hypothetical protein [Arthrobacter psychrolactophilus]
MPGTLSKASARTRDRAKSRLKRENALAHALLHPFRTVPLAFLATIIVGAGLLMLPISRTDAGSDVLMPALFTAVSAVCVTGLITVDTATFWTPSDRP